MKDSRELGADVSALPPLLRQLLAGRGISGEEAIKRFLHPDFESDLHDPLELLDMDKAVKRIVKAVNYQERVVVYGDYDIDGITATAVMVKAFEAWGLAVQAYIPDRFEEGYGINQAALVKLQAEGAQLVVSVDCGITSVEEADWARRHGLDLIITDHHTPPAVIPQAVAVVNPKRPEDGYPYKELAGVGVAYKLVQAVSAVLGNPTPDQLKWLLDLVALGTVCDVVTLTGENRALVHFGLKVLRQTRRVGLRALADVAGVDIAAIKSSHLGFALGPRMNAAGRLEHAALSLELVLTDDVLRAREIASTLDDLNQQRRADQAHIVESALKRAEGLDSSPVLVLADEAWSHGIVGIAASKLVEQLGKPVLVAQKLGDYTKGSARSVPGFNIVEALRARPELFLKYGGHAYAAGFTIATDKLSELQDHLAHYWLEHGPITTGEREKGEIVVSGVAGLDQQLVDAMRMLEPFGNGNPEPTFEVQDIAITRHALMGSAKQHVRAIIEDHRELKLAMVAFGWGGRLDELMTATTLIGNLNQNEWRGVRTLQFLVRKVFH